MNKKIVMRLVVIIIGCICMLVAAIAMFIGGNKQSNNTKKPTRLEIPNPLTEVKTVSEMNQYLGFTIPVMDKKVEKYIVIGEGKYATHARIIYEDQSEFDMEKGSNDVSGIYGGDKIEEKVYNNITVTFYKKDKTNYITYQTKEYSYSYSKEDKEMEEEEVLQLMKISR
ncbi:MAG: hypothetical protein IJ193_05995 [Bacilli bacterium]|nr:hypothetical protein [Bacilli bacterium]